MAIRGSRSLILVLTLAALALPGCQPRGIPGSYLLTPLGINPPTETLTPAPTSSSTATLTSTPSPSPTATLSPSPSSTATRAVRPTFTATWDGTPSRTPTKTLVPTRTRRPTSTPTITRTPTPLPAQMRIVRPGPYSLASSPFRVDAVVLPGSDSQVHLRLIGEDGSDLQHLALDFRGYEIRKMAIDPEVSFELEVVSALARLELFTYDQFERMNYLTSVELVLLQLGDSDLDPNPDQREPFLIRQPAENGKANGGVVAVSGVARLVNDQPLIIELLDEQGQVLDSAELELTQPTAALSHIPFSAQLTYTVDKAVEALLVVRQESATRIPGTVALSSRPVLLRP